MFRKIRQIRLSARFARLRVLFANFQSNSRGNVAVITALAALPMVAAIGCVIDYSNASMIRTKLQAAADAAALATVSINSPVIATAKGMSGGGTVSGGSTYASNFFSANLPAGYTSVSPTATVTLTRNDNHCGGVVFDYSFHLLHGDPRLSEHHDSELIHGELQPADLHQFLSDARRLRIDELPVDRRRASETDGGQSLTILPANSPPNNGYPQGCQFACHFAAQGACGQCPPETGYCPQQALRSSPRPFQGPTPPWVIATEVTYRTHAPGGYCQGFTISRLGTTPVSFTSGTNNPTNGAM